MTGGPFENLGEIRDKGLMGCRIVRESGVMDLSQRVSTLDASDMAHKISVASEAIHEFRVSLGLAAAAAAETKEDVKRGTDMIIDAVGGSAIQLLVTADSEVLDSRLTVIASLLETARQLHTQVSALSTNMADRARQVAPMVAAINPGVEQYQVAGPATEIVEATEQFFGKIS